MFMAGKIYSFVLAILLSTPLSAKKHPEVVYGEDTRLDLYEVQAPNSHLKTLAKSTAVIMQKDKISFSAYPGFSSLEVQSIEEAFNICSYETFSQQPTAGFCSSFLVADDILVTAGHCINNYRQCKNSAIVFDYAYTNGSENLEYVITDNIYYCDHIISSEYNILKKIDYSVIKLNRPVLDRQPLRVRSKGKIGYSTKISTIGYPLGLPAKVTTSARIRKNAHDSYFVTNTDTFHGSSGSPVFNQEGLVEGILVRGEDDYAYQDNCKVNKVCDSNKCRGEDVTRSTVFSEFIYEQSPQ